MSKSTDSLPVPTDHGGVLGSNPYTAAAVSLWGGSTGAVEDLDSYAKSANTLKGYRSDWDGFAEWANGQGVPLPPVVDGVVDLPADVPVAVIKVYLAEKQNELKAATLARHVSAIRHFHHQAGLVSPTDHPEVKRSMAGLQRKHSYQPDRARPLFLEDLRRGLPTGTETKAVRDRAVLLVGWWGALRRSELVAIEAAHLSDHPEGVVITIPKSKTDQTGQGQQVALHYREDLEIDPVRSLRAWTALTDGPGPVFRSVDRWGNVRPRPIDGDRVSALVKDLCERVGLDPAEYSAHSLRAGFVSECDRRHIPSGAVRAVTRHTSDSMLNVYERPGELFDGSAGAYFEGV